jgi:hypothetical protein
MSEAIGLSGGGNKIRVIKIWPPPGAWENHRLIQKKSPRDLSAYREGWRIQNSPHARRPSITRPATSWNTAF